MESGRRKELQKQYVERDKTGGVYLIRNTLNNKLYIEAAVDLQSNKNRFEFAQKTGSCIYLKLQKDWESQGPSDFVFEVLEELTKNESQSPEAFKADVLLLAELWRDKLANESFY